MSSMHTSHHVADSVTVLARQQGFLLRLRYLFVNDHVVKEILEVTGAGDHVIGLAVIHSIGSNQQVCCHSFL